MQHGAPLLFWPHFSRNVHFGAGNVRVHIDTTRHHDHTGRINNAMRIGRLSRRLNYLAIPNPDVAHLAVNTVCRIKDQSTLDLK
jgi:head-tail adaptor